MPSITIGFAPVRCTTRVWTNVAVIAIAAVIGRNATPVFSGEKPRFRCMKYERNRNTLNTAENASRSLPLILGIGGMRSVTVVTSGWHLRTRLFFAPYRRLGLRLSFAWAIDLPSPRLLWHEL